jgi:putative adenylate-forming enzyme
MYKKLLILSHYLRAKRCLKFTSEQLMRWQQKHKRKIENFARNYSSFYREYLGEVLSKKEMMAHFSTFNTKGILKEEAFALAFSAEERRDFDSQIGDVTVGLSSGTSGNRGLFLVSEKERLSWCGNILAKILPSPPWKHQKIALFLRANSMLYQTIQSNTLTFSYFDLLEDPDSLRKKVSRFDPDILVAPPSMLLLLRGSCHPKRVVSVAETLFSLDEEALKCAFQQNIFQIYQCTEGFLGFTCSHGTLHLNEDLLIFEKERLDSQSFIPIITDLFRKTQPIVRYRLDDVLVERKEPCPCGCIFQSLERIEGRCDDLLFVLFPDGSKRPLFPDFVSRKILAASEEIQDYTVVQTSPTQWEIYLKPGMEEPVRRALITLFSQIGCIPPQLSFIDRKYTRPPGTKMRRIWRNYASS